MTFHKISRIDNKFYEWLQCQSIWKKVKWMEYVIHQLDSCTAHKFIIDERTYFYLFCSRVDDHDLLWRKKDAQGTFLYRDKYQMWVNHVNSLTVKGNTSPLHPLVLSLLVPVWRACSGSLSKVINHALGFVIKTWIVITMSSIDGKKLYRGLQSWVL